MSLSIHDQLSNLIAANLHSTTFKNRQEFSRHCHDISVAIASTVSDVSSELSEASAENLLDKFDITIEDEYEV